MTSVKEDDEGQQWLHYHMCLGLKRVVGGSSQLFSITESTSTFIRQVVCFLTRTNQEYPVTVAVFHGSPASTTAEPSPAFPLFPSSSCWGAQA